MTPFSQEVLNLVGLNGRDENEEVTKLRNSYATTMQKLCDYRDEAGRSEAGRNYSIAITELENSCMRAIKAIYSSYRE